MSERPEYLLVGEVAGIFGTQGEIKLSPETEFPERFRPGSHIWVGPEKTKYCVQSARRHRPHILLKLEGIDGVEKAEALRGASVFVPTEEAVPLEEGAYYHYQIIGLQVMTQQGDDLGRVTDILVTGSNDVYVVMGKQGEILIPATREVVKSISPDTGVMVVEPLAGLLATEEHGE
ncbi:MAG: ribosome maturation factor RimM [Chloroflexi bacterium]|nr:ribosome maturation factor RimM [Chloroflexota bacterium]